MPMRILDCGSRTLFSRNQPERERISPRGQRRKDPRAWCVCVLFSAISLMATAQTSASGPAVLDRVVAVVNNQPILWSDVANEIRFSVLDPEGVNGTLSPQHALQQLISRTLIQQQIRQEDESAALPNDEEVAAREQEVRKELPECVRLNCTTEAGWKAFQKKNGITAEQIDNYLRLRLELLRFIEIRFRQGIRISPEETEAYYRDKLLPQYPKGSQPPPLTAVSARIQEILLEDQVNVIFGNWLDNLRKQGDVEVLDASLETAATPPLGSRDVE
jgi:peptidyl-prolyl cis-trans isomerase SurA